MYRLGVFVIFFCGKGLEETVVTTVFEDIEDAIKLVELLVQSLENGYGKNRQQSKMSGDIFSNSFLFAFKSTFACIIAYE